MHLHTRYPRGSLGPPAPGAWAGWGGDRGVWRMALTAAVHSPTPPAGWGAPPGGANPPALHLPWMRSPRGHPQAATDQLVHGGDVAHMTAPGLSCGETPHHRGPLPSSVLQKSALLFWGAPVAEGPGPDSPQSNNE